MTTSTPHKRRHSIFLLFSSESVDEVKEIKIRTANIIGKPSPFLMMAPKGSYKEHHKQAYAITNLSKSKLVVVDVFCLFSKLTLVASMEYPVLTVLLFAIFKISNFCLFVYTDKMSAGSVFFFSRSVLE
jgi:hypothetical protein